MEQVFQMLEISRSGYYDWSSRKTSACEKSNRALKQKLIELHEKYPAWGLDSLHHMLKPEFGRSRKRVHRQMRLAGIYSARHRAYKVTALYSIEWRLIYYMALAASTIGFLEPGRVCAIAQIDSGYSWHIRKIPFVPSFLSITGHHTSGVNKLSVRSLAPHKPYVSKSDKNHQEFCRQKSGDFAPFFRSKAARKILSADIYF